MIIRELQRTNMMSASGYSTRLKLYPISQLVITLPLTVLYLYYSLSGGKVNFIFAYCCIVITSFRSIIFGFVFGCTKGIMLRFKNRLMSILKIEKDQEIFISDDDNREINNLSGRKISEFSDDFLMSASEKISKIA